MHYYRIGREGSEAIVARRDGDYYDLTAADRAVGRFADLARAARISDRAIDGLAASLCERAPTVDAETVRERALWPVDPAELWTAGVTYSTSRSARSAEGGLGGAYLTAHESERPEVTCKGAGHRAVGPGDRVGIRGDSDRDIPEPELTVVLYDGDPVGYTVGNDVCSRDIERENLLYLSQSKIYARSCAVGPAVATATDPTDVEIGMAVERDGATVFEGSASTAEMTRSIDELVDYLTRHNDLPDVTLLLTGASMVPDDFSLREGDVVEIDIDGIGRLRNPVVEV